MFGQFNQIILKGVKRANFLFDILIELAEIHNNLKFELDRSSGSKVMTILVSKLDKIDFLHSFVLYCFLVKMKSLFLIVFLTP